jgi:hydroxymethylbilane synthase
MIVIGSRGSDLALAQSRWVAARLAEAGAESRIEIIRTQGDRVQDLSFDKLEGKGFFTKEIEEALLASRIDVAVHSFKDLPTASPPGLRVAAMPEREDPRDCLLVRRERHAPGAAELPLAEGATVGTGAVRRQAQLRFLRPDLQVSDLRGNVPTRVGRLREGRFDAVLLARAGLLRLGLDLEDLVVLPLEPERFVPAPAQGALGLQVREGDEATGRLVEPLADPATVRCVSVERDLLARLEGGCQLPLGAYVTEEKANGGRYRLRVFLGETEAWGPARRLDLVAESAEELGERAFREITGR